MHIVCVIALFENVAKLMQLKITEAENPETFKESIIPRGCSQPVGPLKEYAGNTK